MRRIWTICVLCVMASGATAWASAHATRGPARAPVARRHVRVDRRATRRTKGKRRVRSTKRTAVRTVKFATAAAASDPVLFGDQVVEADRDSNASGQAQAWRFSSSTSGTTASISVYVDSANTATNLTVGLYADNSGSPGSRLATGSVSKPTAGAWNTISIGSASVSSGRAYWIAVLGTSGTPYFRDRQSGTCQTQGSAQTKLTSLPSTWSTGPTWTGYCPVSAYVNGYLTATVSAPSNTALPTVSGTAQQGSTLTATTGTWTGTPTSYAYQWRQCDSSGNNCMNVSGATASSYQPPSGDVGHTMRVVVTATNAGGSTAGTSTQTAAIAARPVSAPSNTALPVVSGTATQGQTLTTGTGTWTGTSTYAYQWRQCDASGNNCANISSATSSTYTLSSAEVAHTVRSVVTATNAGGSASASSAATAAVTAPPTNSVLFGDQAVESNQDSNAGGSAQAFSVSNSTGGTAQSIAVYVDGGNAATSLTAGLYAANGSHPGTMLASGTLSSVHAGAWNSIPITATAVTPGTYWIAILGTGGTLNFRDQVSSSCTTETSAQGTLSSLPSTWSTGGVWANSYCPLSAYVSGSSTGGSQAPPSPPTESAVPTISGTTTVGQTLSTTNGTWSNSPTTFSYQWQRCTSSCSDIAGATSSSYMLQQADANDTIDVAVTATNMGGSGTATASQTSAVSAGSGSGGGGNSGLAGTPVSTASPTITDTTSANRWGYTDQLSTTNGTWTVSGTTMTCGPSTGIVCAYQWQRSSNGGSTWSNITTGDCLVICQSTYRIQPADIGSDLRVIVTAGDAAGSTDAMAAPVGGSSGAGNLTCNYTVSSLSALNSAYSSASAGQTICLNSGSYGTFNPTSGTAGAAHVTIMPTPGASPTPDMTLDVNGGKYLTVAGVTLDNATLEGATHDVTLYDSTVPSSGQIVVLADSMSASSNLVVDDETVSNQSCTGFNLAGRIHVEDAGNNNSNPLGLTVSNNYLSGGSADGIRPDAGSGWTIIGNEFTQFNDQDPCHTDDIQFAGSAANITIKDNFFYNQQNVAECSVSGFNGVDHMDFENNVVAGTASNGCAGNGGGDGSIALYGDVGSIVNHNVLAPTGICGGSKCDVGLDYASPNVSGTGTVLRDNAEAGVSNPNSGTSFSDDHNMCSDGSCSATGDKSTGAGDMVSTTPAFVGGSYPSTFAGFALATGSAGIGKASDGTNIGLELPTGYPYPR